MRNAIKIILASLLIISNIHSQCTVDAGTNRNLCQDEILNSPTLNGEIISGDVTEVSWSSEYYQASLDLYYYASTMLNDTSILVPTIEQHFDKTVKYYLTGKTADNQTCIDSVELNFSDWLYLTIDKITGKAPSDTIELWIASQSNWDHIKYEWSPNYMISDTTIENPKVWNDTTVFYNLQITDELNCTVTDDLFEVYVSPSSVDRLSTEKFTIFPNPTSSEIHIESSKKVESLTLYDYNSRFIQRTNSEIMDLSNLKQGQYILNVLFSDQSSKSQIIQVNQ